MKTGQAQEFSMDDVLESIRRIISDGEAPADGDLAAHGDPAISRGFLEGFEQAARTVSLAEPEAAPPRAPAASSLAGTPHPFVDRPQAAAASRPAAARPAPVQTPRPGPALRGTAEPVRAEPVRAEMPAPPADYHAVPPPAAPVHPVADPPMSFGSDRLLSRAAESAVESAFGSLGHAVVSRQPQPQTLEDLVKELMRPMVSAWLDRNLPALVERLVQAEIQRLARRN